MTRVGVLSYLRVGLRAVIRQTAANRNPARTDLTYWFLTPLVTRFVTRVALGLVLLLAAMLQGRRSKNFAWPTRQAACRYECRLDCR
jgi:hypothetical protein